MEQPDDLAQHVINLAGEDPHALADSLAEIERRIIQPTVRKAVRRNPYDLDADDTLQAVRRAVVRAAKWYDPSRPAAPYLAVVTHRAVATELKRARSRRDKPNRFALSLDDAAHGKDGDQRYGQILAARPAPDPALRELVPQLVRLLPVFLTARQTAVWRRWHTGSAIGHDNYESLARELGLTKKQVDVALNNARIAFGRASLAAAHHAHLTGEPRAVSHADRLDQLVRYLLQRRDVLARVRAEREAEKTAKAAAQEARRLARIQRWEEWERNRANRKKGTVCRSRN